MDRTVEYNSIGIPHSPFSELVDIPIQPAGAAGVQGDMAASPSKLESTESSVNPALICKVPSGWLFLCNMQFLRGYCILQSDPVVASINDLEYPQRSQFLHDMTLAGDAILEVTGSYRINYFIAGNSDPVLHAHIVPRYMTEPDEMRKGLPWAYPGYDHESTRFDYDRDEQLIGELKLAIEKRS